MAKRLAFINGKGGVGKSTGVFNVAGVLSKKGEKVLVIDLDKQGNTADTVLMWNKELPKKTVLDFLRGDAEAEEVTAQALWQTRGNAKYKYYGVDCMMPDERLEDEVNLADIDGKRAGERLEKFVEENGYTWVLVDMPPSNLTLNNICFKYFVDYLISPFSCDAFSVKGYQNVMKTLDKARSVNPKLILLGCYFPRYRAQRGTHNYILDNVSAYQYFIDIQIPDSPVVEETLIFGRPISYYKVFHECKTAYEKLVAEIIKRMN